MKIGIYAGTFDPIHAGHIEFAKNAIKQAKLDKVIIIAEKDPYRKKPHASWNHRQAMIQRATQDLEKVDHDYKFSNELAYQHNMQDMISQAKVHYGDDKEFWFLVGSDIFEHMGEWKNFVQSESYGGFVVALKHDHTAQWLRSKLNELNRQGIHINTILVDHKQANASSSIVRDSIINKSSLPLEAISSVVEYANEHNLYHES